MWKMSFEVISSRELDRLDSSIGWNLVFKLLVVDVLHGMVRAGHFSLWDALLITVVLAEPKLAVCRH